MEAFFQLFRMVTYNMLGLEVVVLSFVPHISIDFTLLILSFSIALAIFILDYFIPFWVYKKFGGEKRKCLRNGHWINFYLFLGPPRA